MPIQQSKSVFCKTDEGVQIQIFCQHTLKFEINGINTQFHKSPGNNGGSKTNKKCSQYLGVTIAEKVLSKVFKDVVVMPSNNHGYDFICNKGKKIDVKSTVEIKHKNSNWCGWMFHIRKNIIPEYFLCLGFDNRKDLNPKHLWLIPSEKIRNLSTFSISKSKLDKWKQYELIHKLNNITTCCNVLKGD